MHRYLIINKPKPTLPESISYSFSHKVSDLYVFKILGSFLDPLAFIPRIGGGWVFTIFQDLSSVSSLLPLSPYPSHCYPYGLTTIPARPALLLPLVLQLFLNTVNRVVLSKSNSDVSLFSWSGVPFLLWPELFLSHPSFFSASFTQSPLLFPEHTQLTPALRLFICLSMCLGNTANYFYCLSYHL